MPLCVCTASFIWKNMSADVFTRQRYVGLTYRPDLLTTNQQVRYNQQVSTAVGNIMMGDSVQALPNYAARLTRSKGTPPPRPEYDSLTDVGAITWHRRPDRPHLCAPPIRACGMPVCRRTSVVIDSQACHPIHSSRSPWIRYLCINVCLP